MKERTGGRDGGGRRGEDEGQSFVELIDRI